MCSCQIAADLILMDGSHRISKIKHSGNVYPCIASLPFPSFLNPKTTKIQEFGQNKTPPFAKESSKCYQCLSGFKYCSSPEISSSALVIQDQGALAFDLCSWESSSRSKPKSRRGVSTGHWLSNQVEEGCSGSLTVLDKTLITDCQCQAEGIFTSVSQVY